MCVSAVVSIYHMYVYVCIFAHFFVSVVCVCVYTSVCAYLQNLSIYTYFLVYKHIISDVQLLTLLWI